MQKSDREIDEELLWDERTFGLQPSWSDVVCEQIDNELLCLALARCAIVETVQSRGAEVLARDPAVLDKRERFGHMFDNEVVHRIDNPIFCPRVLETFR